MRPGILFGATFIWLVCTGGRFTAPFLETALKFDEKLIGVTFALEVFFGSISSLGSVKVDQLERKYPQKGRIGCLILLVAIASIFFQLHFIILYYTNEENEHSAIVFHIVCRIMYSVTMTLMFPILDGITLSYLKERNADDSEYGKERKFGAVTWACASVIIGPLIDKFGFHVFFWSSPASSIFCICILLKYMNDPKTAMEPDDCTNHIMEGSCPIELEMLDLNETQEKTQELPGQSSSNISRERQSMMIFKAMFSSYVGLGFLICMITLNMGTSVVERLIFLFFGEQLNGSNAICGLTVIVTVLFEVPIFNHSPGLLVKYGPNMLQKVACLAYIIRVVGYTFIPKDHVILVLLLEPLHGVTYGLAKTSSVEFAARLSPSGFESTGQGIISMLQGLGSIIGLSLGGWTEETFSAVVLYRVYALIVTFGLACFCFATCSENSIQEKSQKYTGVSKDCIISNADDEI